MGLQIWSISPKIVAAILNPTFQVVSWLVRTVLAWIYQGKGKIVPPVRVQRTILLKSATDIAKEIREGKLKSVDVVQAYIQRIQEVEPFINATVERVFDDALQRAQEADQMVASGDYTVEQLSQDKPLLGVPITIKNLMDINGVRITAGSTILKDHMSSKDAVVVARLKNAGAIVIATTNTPDSALHLESTNLVHGRTNNPYNTSRTSGGSSGGESGLLAAAGSVLGIGNDLLGSIRLPCHFTGLFGHKPSSGLVSCEGIFPSVDITLHPFISTGPMCRYSKDLVTSMKVLSTKNDINFEKPVNFKNLKIRCVLKLEDICATPVEKEMIISLKKAASYFQTKYGIDVQEVRLPYLTNTNLMCLHLLMSSIKNIQNTITGGKGNHINVKWDLLKFLLGLKSSFSLMPLLILNFVKYPLYNKARVPYYKDMLKKLAKVFDDLLDENTVLFLPTFPVSAPYHGEIFFRFPSVGYTGIFNFIGLPVTQCPLGLNKEGLPYGMQIVGKLNNDPLTIACALELEKVFGGWIQPGHTR